LFCADTSCWIPYLAGDSESDVELIATHLRERSLVMSPMVLAELLSDPLRSIRAREALLDIPSLELNSGFWERAGLTRASLLKRHIKPRLADALIAQVCIDHNLPLHSRDTDFRPFAKHAGLQLVLHGLVN
jgi:predicted nucleic acid-binding protein